MHRGRTTSANKNVMVKSIDWFFQKANRFELIRVKWIGESIQIMDQLELVVTANHQTKQPVRMMLSVDWWSDGDIAAGLWWGLHEREVHCCCWLQWCCDVMPHLGVQAQYATCSGIPRGYWQTGHDYGNGSVSQLHCLSTIAQYKFTASSHFNYCRIIIILDFFYISLVVWVAVSFFSAQMPGIKNVINWIMQMIVIYVTGDYKAVEFITRVLIWVIQYVYICFFMVFFHFCGNEWIIKHAALMSA